jgi:LuxR family maltose regulon positive regulatory protein
MRTLLGGITVPDRPPGHIRRAHLLDRLDASGAGRIVVVAPPGYGKTVLLADWVAGRPGGPPGAWVSLAGVDDAARFRSGLRTALGRALGRELGGEPSARPAGPAGDDLVEQLAALLDGAPQPVRLVVDDLQELTSAEVLDDLVRLARRGPAGLQLVLASRREPPRSLAGPRSAGGQYRLPADDLRFSPDETAAFLRACGRQLRTDQVASLHARTGGWAAGLRFAVRALSCADDPAAVLEHFPGGDSAVADYLTGEVMSALPVQERRFLQVAAVCAELPVGLAAALTRRADAGRVLEQLVRDSALVQGTGTGSYRILPLLRTYLRADLERQQPALYRRSQAAAARWWLRSGDPVHALRHAQRAGDPQPVVALLRAQGVRLVGTGRLDAVRQALAAAWPSGETADRWTALLDALTQHLAGAHAEARAALRRARRVRTGRADPATDALRTSVEWLVTGEQPACPCREGAADLPPELRSLRELCRATACTGTVGADPDDLAARLDGVLAVATERGLPYFAVWARSMSAVLEAGRGSRPAMTSAATPALAEAARLDRQPVEWTAQVSALLAHGDLLVGDAAAARARTTAALDAGALPPAAEYALRVVLTTALADLGEQYPGGPEACRAARAACGDTPVAGLLLAAPAVLEHRAAVVRGRPEVGAEIAEWLERRVGKVAEVLLMDAWAHLAELRWDAAAAAAGPIATGSVPVLLAHSPVEAHLVLAEAALRAGDPDRGRAEVRTALSLGADLDVVRPFTAAGAATVDLLRSAPPALTGTPLGRRVAAVLATTRPGPAAPLSERERAVLALLPSLLSAGEIADELTVSVNTVKSHIRSIYSKLGVSTRRDAVRLAHEHALLS